MFGFFGGGASMLAGGYDVENERAAVPLPTPVNFPPYPPFPQRETRSWTGRGSPDLARLFAEIRKPSDITAEHLTALNISLQPICDFEDIIPVSSDGTPSLPPKSWLEPYEESSTREAHSSNTKQRLLHNGRPFPTQKDFYVRLKELQHNNADAFAALARTTRSDQPAPRLAHFRRFWESLDGMSNYWDTSQDEYIPPETDDANESKARPESLDINAMQIDEPRKRAKPNPDPRTTASSSEQPLPPLPPLPPSPDTPAGTYRGRRIDNGAGMPEQLRVDTVRNFVEPIAWSFGFTLSAHRRPPVLAIGNLMVPVRMSIAAWRNPSDRQKARAGWLEGPVLGVSCRSKTFGPPRNRSTSGTKKGSIVIKHEGSSNCEAPGVDDTTSVETEEEPGEGALLDLLREIGGMLFLAQERSRQGQEETKPGEEQWWTRVPRWGGGPGGEVGDARGDQEKGPVMNEGREKEKEYQKKGKGPGGPSSRRKISPAEAWKIVRPGTGYWDPKVTYCAIGKDRDSEYDEIFVISSLNHHISILKLRVHQTYLEYLSTGSLPRDVPSDSAWSSPTFQRTRWLDFFNVEDRLEAMRGIWGMMAYMARMPESAEVTMGDS